MQAEPAQPSETITKSNSTWRDQSSSQTATCSSGIAKTITVVVATTVVTATMMATVLEGSQQATKAGPGCGNRDYFTCTIETCASEPFQDKNLSYHHQSYINVYLHHRRYQAGS